MTLIETRTLEIICHSLPEIAKQLKRIADEVETKTCCICGKPFKGYGNNPYPIKDAGVCCDECNSKVVAARIEAMKGENGNEGSIAE